MTTIDEKVSPIYLSAPVDDRYLTGISKYTNKDRLSIAERDVLTMIKEDMEIRYYNYETSKTYKAISSALGKTGIGTMSVEGDFNHIQSMDLTSILYHCDPYGVLSSEVRNNLSNKIDRINGELYPEYHVKQ